MLSSETRDAGTGMTRLHKDRPHSKVTKSAKLRMEVLKECGGCFKTARRLQAHRIGAA